MTLPVKKINHDINSHLNKSTIVQILPFYSVSLLWPSQVSLLFLFHMDPFLWNTIITCNNSIVRNSWCFEASNLIGVIIIINIQMDKWGAMRSFNFIYQTFKMIVSTKISIANTGHLANILHQLLYF